MGGCFITDTGIEILIDIFLPLKCFHLYITEQKNYVPVNLCTGFNILGHCVSNIYPHMLVSRSM